MSDGISGERFAGSACFVVGGSGLILEVQKTHKWRRDRDGRWRVGIGLIGGSIEPGESPIEALQREAHEEIGCPLHLLPARSTIELASGPHAWARRWTAGEPRPVFVWNTEGDWEDPEAKVVVYLGYPVGVPQPHDLPAIASFEIDLLHRLAYEELTVAAACEAGAELTQREAIPPQALLETTGTLSVFHSLCRTHQTFAEAIAAEIGAVLALHNEVSEG